MRVDEALKLEQRSEGWLEAKLGVFGGTSFDVVQSTGAGFDTLVLEKAAQRLTRDYSVDFGNQHTEWGNFYEDYARERYEFLTGNTVRQVGLYYSPWSDWVAVSPDGLVDPTGGIEIKCPSTSKEHLRHIVYGPGKYTAQIQGCMMVTGRQWWDFVSYDPRLENHEATLDKALHIQRIPRDEEYIANLRLCVDHAVAEVDRLVNLIIGDK